MSVSTPRIMSALVEEAVTVGDLVRLFTFHQGDANMVELTLPDDSPFVGLPGRRRPVAAPTPSLVAILREGRVHRARPRRRRWRRGDELLFVAAEDQEGELESLLAPVEHNPAS